MLYAARRRPGSSLPRPDRHQPRPTRPPPGPRRLPRRRDLGGRTKLDRLARSLPDARNIVEELADAGVELHRGQCTTPPTRSVGCCSTCSRRLSLIRVADPDGRHKGRDEKTQGRGRRGKQPELKPCARGPPGRAAARRQAPPPTWPICSTWPAPSATGPCNAPSAGADPRRAAAGCNSIAAGDSTVNSTRFGARSLSAGAGTDLATWRNPQQRCGGGDGQRGDDGGHHGGGGGRG